MSLCASRLSLPIPVHNWRVHAKPRFQNHSVWKRASAISHSSRAQLTRSAFSQDLCGQQDKLTSLIARILFLRREDVIHRNCLKFSVVILFGLCFSAQSAAGQPQLHGTQTVDPKHPNSFRDCPECPEMVRIPTGAFLMGAGNTDTKGFIDEGPQHRVSLKGFSISKFDITRGEWKTFVEATSRATSQGCGYSGLPKEERSKASWQYVGFPQDDRHPVVCVTFQDAIDYASWLSKRTGRTYRLLSEAEWEYAARAGTTTTFPWGSGASHESANYGGEDSPGPGLAQGRDEWVGTSPVGSFPPNAFGLFDVNGNVMQWVQDCFSNAYTTTPMDGSAYEADLPLAKMTGNLSFMNGTNSCSYRMLRGGDWGDPPSMIRSAFRNFAPSKGQTLATYRSAGLGIRIARSEK
jgi:formylglycine-generating enzyme required for sulfatase activity